VIPIDVKRKFVVWAIAFALLVWFQTTNASRSTLSLRANTVRALMLAHSELQTKLRSGHFNSEELLDINRWAFILEFDGKRFIVRAVPTGLGSEWRLLTPVYYIDRSGRRLLARTLQ
jgi:hypothetical protein